MCDENLIAAAGVSYPYKGLGRLVMNLAASELIAAV
jgi:hypothetical protein